MGGRRPARFLACARNTVFLVAMYGRTGSLSRPVGELVQVGQVAADADAGSGLSFWEEADGAVRHVEPFPPRR